MAASNQLSFDLSGRPARHNVEMEKDLCDLELEFTALSAPVQSYRASIVSASAGVDYLRVVTLPGMAIGSLKQVFHTLGQELYTSGCAIKPWGFSGYLGEQIGSLAFGQRMDGACLQVSGFLAHTAFGRIPDGAGRCSRIDLQVTLTTKGDGNEARDAAQSSAFHRALAKGSGRPWRVAYTDGFGDGDTAYFGSRSSRTFGRLYDKTAESRGDYPPNTWRWELECKREVAHATYDLLKTYGGAVQTIASLVGNRFRGWAALPSYFDTTGVQLPTYHYEPTTVERRLDWLQRQVRPSIRELTEAGYTSEVVERLFSVEHHLDDNPLDADELDALQYELRGLNEGFGN